MRTLRRDAALRDVLASMDNDAKPESAVWNPPHFPRADDDDDVDWRGAATLRVTANDDAMVIPARAAAILCAERRDDYAPRLLFFPIYILESVGRCVHTQPRTFHDAM